MWEYRRQSPYPHTTLSVCARYYHTALGRLACNHADSLFLLSVKRYAAYGGFSLLLDSLLGLDCAVPMGKEEASVFDSFFKLLVREIGRAHV